MTFLFENLQVFFLIFTCQQNNITCIITVDIITWNFFYLKILYQDDSLVATQIPGDIQNDFLAVLITHRSIYQHREQVTL